MRSRVVELYYLYADPDPDPAHQNLFLKIKRPWNDIAYALRPKIYLHSFSISTICRYIKSAGGVQEDR